EEAMPQIETVTGASNDASLETTFERLREGYRRDPYPSFEERIGALDTLAEVVKKHSDEITEAARQDFGHRSPHDTKIAEVFTLLQLIKYIRGNLRTWMDPERRETQVTFLPARNEVR